MMRDRGPPGSETVRPEHIRFLADWVAAPEGAPYHLEIGADAHGEVVFRMSIGDAAGIAIAAERAEELESAIRAYGHSLYTSRADAWEETHRALSDLSFLTVQLNELVRTFLVTNLGKGA